MLLEVLTSLQKKKTGETGLKWNTSDVFYPASLFQDYTNKLGKKERFWMDVIKSTVREKGAKNSYRTEIQDPVALMAKGYM